MSRTRAVAPVAVALLLCSAMAIAIASGCAAKPSVVGTWVAPTTSGKPANLSDLTLAKDGTFTYAGQNALGGKVTFSGTYRLSTTPSGPTITLVYADFPDRPTVWYYRVTASELAVSTLPGNLKNGTALQFTRQAAP